VGGLVGGLSVAIIAPQVFLGMWEYPLCWLVLMSLVLKRLYTEANRAIHERRTPLGLAAFGLGWVIAAAVFFADIVLDHRDAEAVYRNFFGRLAISKKRDKLCLYHGRIQHGCQWSDPERAREPTTYYGLNSGVGLAVRVMRESRERENSAGLHIGVVGLGIGTSATFGKAGDTIRFFELDPMVAKIAKDRFTYLGQSEADVAISIGDARVALERENGHRDHERFDVLVLDAFSGDAIPLHLLTREAFALYWRRLKKDGILAVHISNHYFDLEPLLLGHAAERSKEALLIYTEESASKLIYDSTWVILTGNEKAAKTIRDLGHAEEWPDDLKDPIVFTDQHSNLLELL
jgi:hypothetical protein